MKRWAYVYGITAEAPKLDGCPKGVPDANEPRAVEVADGVHLVLSDADPAAWSEERIEEGLHDLDWVGERALRHDDVLGFMVEAHSVLPMKAFTLFRSEKSALEHVRTRIEDVRASLARVDAAVELGLRVKIDAEAARVPTERTVAAPASGADFLRRKKAMHEAGRDARGRLYSAARTAAEALGAYAREAKVVPLPENASGAALLFEVAYLVPRAARASFEGEVSSMSSSLRELGGIVELTGPWAPFHFSAARS